MQFFHSGAWWPCLEVEVDAIVVCYPVLHRLFHCLEAMVLACLVAKVCRLLLNVLIADEHHHP